MLALCKAACAGLQTSHVKLHKLSPTAKANLTILVSKASAQWLTAAVTAVYTLKGMYSACFISNARCNASTTILHIFTEI